MMDLVKLSFTVVPMKMQLIIMKMLTQMMDPVKQLFLDVLIYQLLNYNPNANIQIMVVVSL